MAGPAPQGQGDRSGRLLAAGKALTMADSESPDSSSRIAFTVTNPRLTEHPKIAADLLAALRRLRRKVHPSNEVHFVRQRVGELLIDSEATELVFPRTV